MSRDAGLAGRRERTNMKVESVIAWGGWLTALLAVAVCLGIATLLGFGYRATREWQRSSELLIERDTEESADLLVTAVTRDMRGAHSRVLANRDWGELSLESLTDTSDQVATAFARYPYPESFFSWQRDSPHGVVFFNRANRFPAWMPQPTEPNRYPGRARHESAGSATRCATKSRRSAPRGSAMRPST